MMIDLVAVGLGLCVSFALGFLVSRLSRSRPDPANDLGLSDAFADQPIPMMVYTWDTLKIVATNEAANRQYGFEAGELIGHHVLELRREQDLPAFRAKCREIDAKAIKSGLSGEWVHVRKDGSEVDVKTAFQLFERNKQKFCLISSIDITERVLARQQLVAAKKMLETVLNSVPLSIYWKDRHSVFLGCNDAFAKEIGLSDVANVVGLTDYNMPWRASADDIVRRDAAAMAAPSEPMFYEKNIRVLPDFHERWYAQSKVALVDATGDVFGILAVHEDITQRKSTELSLALRSRALDACVNAVLITRPTIDGNLIEYANPAFERITGYPESEWIGRDCSFLQRDDTAQPGLEKIRRALAEKIEVETTVRNYRRDGAMFFNHLYIGPVRDENGAVTHHIAVINDVTEVTESRDRLQFQANFDSLTSLPNRQMFLDRLGAALAKAAVLGTRITVAFVDVDHFKDVNDSLGHGVGDALLQELSVRLVGSLPPEAIVARYGGDEFVFFVPEGPQGLDASDVAREVNAVLSATAWVDGHELDVNCSVGLCEFPRDGDDAETLIKRADSAMYEAKSLGRNQLCTYDDTIGRRIEQRLHLTRLLKHAVRNSEFTLAFQPQVDVIDKKIVALEVLLRWRDPVAGPIAPSIFIPLAEESGLILPIGDWVLSEACSHAQQLLELGLDVRMAVNVSARQFGQGGLEEAVERTLHRHRLPARMLELEVTESTLTTARFTSSIQRIAETGVSIAVDDFGTGYSNLSALRTVRPDRIKIDMSLVRGIGGGAQDEALVLAVLSLGQALGAVVLAEGVETEQQYNFLAAHGCREMQGYYFARPMSFSSLLKVLERPEALFESDDEIAGA